MDKDFLIIAVTPEFIFPGEAERICKILQSGEASFVHVRKPGVMASQVARLLEEIPSDYHERLKLHDHFELLEKYDLGGIHLNSRNPIAPENVKSVSKSLHSLAELEEAPKYNYVTLSPIFDSISKKGYKSAFDSHELKVFLKNYHNVIALGGVVPDKFHQLKNIGFAGAALLGYFFP